MENLFPSILDSFVLQIKNSVPADINLAQLEIEAKFGRFIDKNTNQRVNASPGVLTPGQKWYRFESDLPPKIHSFLNAKLNEQIRPGKSWTYKHVKTVDLTYADRLRITKAEADQSKILESIKKTRITDFGIHLPHLKVDIRISINLECPQSVDFKLLESMPVENERRKDRRSYIDEVSQIRYDLTDVQQLNRITRNTERKLEMEVETLSPKAVLEDPQHFIQNLLSLAHLLN